MNILAASAPSAGSLAYLVLLPLASLQIQAHTNSLLHIGTRDTAIDTGMFFGRDFLLLQKVPNPKWYEMVASVPKEHRPIVLYDIDDLVWDVPKNNPAYRDWSLMKPGVLACM